jgi:hypothetical protein
LLLKRKDAFHHIMDGKTFNDGAKKPLGWNGFEDRFEDGFRQGLQPGCLIGYKPLVVVSEITTKSSTVLSSTRKWVLV